MPRLPEGQSLETQISSGATRLASSRDFGPDVLRVFQQASAAVGGIARAVEIKNAEMEAQQQRLQGLTDIEAETRFINTMREENDAIFRDAGDLGDPSILAAALAAVKEKAQTRSTDFAAAGTSRPMQLRFDAQQSRQSFFTSRALLDSSEVAKKQNILSNTVKGLDDIASDSNSDFRNWEANADNAIGLVDNIAGSALDQREREALKNAGVLDSIKNSIFGAMDSHAYDVAREIVNSEKADELLPQDAILSLRDKIDRAEKNAVNDAKLKFEGERQQRVSSFLVSMEEEKATEGEAQILLDNGDLTGTQHAAAVVQIRGQVATIAQRQASYEDFTVSMSGGPVVDMESKVNGNQRVQAEGYWRDVLNPAIEDRSITITEAVKTLARGTRGYVPQAAITRMKRDLSSNNPELSTAAADLMVEMSRFSPEYATKFANDKDMLFARILTTNTATKGYPAARQIAENSQAVSQTIRDQRSEEFAKLWSPEQSIERANADTMNNTGALTGYSPDTGQWAWYSSVATFLNLGGKADIPAEMAAQIYQAARSDYLVTGDLESSIINGHTGVISGSGGWSVVEYTGPNSDTGVWAQNAPHSNYPEFNGDREAFNENMLEAIPEAAEIQRERGFLDPDAGRTMRIVPYIDIGSDARIVDGKRMQTYMAVETTDGAFNIILDPDGNIRRWQPNYTETSKYKQEQREAAEQKSRIRFGNLNPNATSILRAFDTSDSKIDPFSQTLGIPGPQTIKNNISTIINRVIEREDAASFTGDLSDLAVDELTE